MKVSIIVPNYNNEKFIAECLDSLLNQTYNNLEIIVVDDGSTDGSFDIIKKYSERDCRIIAIHQINAGVSAARNRGLDIATGDYIGFVDSDDYCMPNMYEKLVEALLKNNSDIAICSFVGQDKKLSQQAYIFDNIQAIIEMDKGRLFRGHLPNKLFKKELFNNIRLDEKIKIFEDLLVLHYVMYNASRIVFIDEELYYYRMNTSSALYTNHFKDSYLTILDAVEAIYSFYEKKLPLYTSVAENQLFYAFSNVIFKLVETKSTHQYSGVLKKCIKGYRTYYSRKYVKQYKGFMRLYMTTLRFSYPLFTIELKMRKLKKFFSK